ncbi:MAG: hypothetical protein A3K66_05745 [Euryarchaeota archaeon RBG_16_67_27]|nr:MAG: hypothetical protein A3K66_05745 [Euryarchaeota archaeon RBG_16_67_27]
MDDFLSTALLLLFLGGATFSWLDWRRRARGLPRLEGFTWACPNCSVMNEPDLAICWSCGAGVSGRILLPGRVHEVESWQCDACRAWNGVKRRTCWSCSTSFDARAKRHA